MESPNSTQCVEIAIFAALEKTLHYAVPDRWSPTITVGHQVLVPLRNHTVTGIVMECHDNLEEVVGSLALKPIIAVRGSAPVVSEDLLRLARWISGYYFYPLGETLRTILPPGLDKKPECLVRLTREGANQPPAEPACELIRHLVEHGPQPWPALRARIKPLKKLREMVSDLTAKGLLEQQFKWIPAGSQRRPVKWIQLRSLPPIQGFGANRNCRQLLQALQSRGGRAPLHELRRDVANIDYWIRKLSRSGILDIQETERAGNRTFAQEIPLEPPPSLNRDQKKVCNAIVDTISAPRFQAFVLHGITGSGKTEVYLKLIEKTLTCGRSALVLVPEIALSTQLEALFRQRFGNRLAVWHSGFTTTTRSELWHDIAGGKVAVTLGVRSAVFSPIRDPGLIVVDEEHDSSYKQEDRLRYHARDVALMRAKMLGIPIVLGSATPSLQSIQHCHDGHYQVLTLANRIDDKPLPDLKIVDMRSQHGPYRFLSKPLQDALSETIAGGHQAILFLNRRGFATFLLCRLCGQVVKCNHCSVSLTYHQAGNRLCCHYCGFSMTPPDACPGCGKTGLLPFGLGTERVEEEVRRLLPKARSVRIDRDTVENPRHLVELLNTVRKGRADILIGTQMIAKGHDFPGITLVGVINADTALQIADFRAGEATVQLLIQVAGRAGRGEFPGRVLLQTYNPDHYTMQSIRRLNYDLFCEQELNSRRQLQYPPFSRFTKLLVTARDPQQARSAVFQLNDLCLDLVQTFREQDRYLAIIGPAPAPISKLKDRYRWHLYVKGWFNRDIQEFVQTVLRDSSRLVQVRRTDLTVDRDPVSAL